MSKAPNAKSIFSQELDRAVFVAYFLGAVVPLLAFAIAIQQYVLPTLGDDNFLAQAAIAITCGILVLSLVAFFMLRRLTHNAISRMNADNERLKAILAASQELSSSIHVQAVAQNAADCARTMTRSDATFLLIRDAEGKPLELIAASGEGARQLLVEHDELLMQVAEGCMATGNPVMLDVGDKGAKGKLVSAANLGAIAAMAISRGESATGALVVVRVDPKQSIAAEEQDALVTLAALTSVAFHNSDLQDSQRNFFAHVTDMLVSALDAHVEGRKGHGHAVAQLANRLARKLGMPDERMQDLHFSALLHDIGMLKISPKNQRSPGHYQKHPVLGHRLLSRIRLWEDVAPIVLCHHEWYDGAGYPEGRKGNEIPIESRIIAVADRFDVLTRNESHRMALSHEEALGEIRKGASTQFDPDVVVALAKLADQGELPTAPG